METTKSSGTVKVRCPSCGQRVPVAVGESGRCPACSHDLFEGGRRAPGQMVRGVSPRGRWALSLVLALVTVAVGGYVFVRQTTGSGRRTPPPQLTPVERASKPPAPPPVPSADAKKPKEVIAPIIPARSPTFAELVQEFGELGIGPGLLSDPRYVALDADGNIWIADYSDGRVQQFDPRGQFLRLIQIPPNRNNQTTLYGLSADGEGRIYVSRQDIFVFEARTGKRQRVIPGPFPQSNYGSVTVDATGNLFAVHTTASDNSLVKLTSEGRRLARWDRIVSRANRDDPAVILDVAVDGQGTIYLVSAIGSFVYVYDARGAFVDRFGGRGDALGQFQHPDSIAVDGHGRVYVKHSRGIDVLDGTGRHLGRVLWDYQRGAPMGITVDRGGFLWAVTNRGRVLQFRITLP